VWLDTDGTWSGGKIPGAKLLAINNVDDEAAFAVKMREAIGQLQKTLRLTIDHPDEPRLYFAVIRGRSVGVFKGWYVFFPSYPHIMLKLACKV
jgi:hypothetical protein